MKKIINPYAGTSEGLGYNCFACAPENPCGLKMEFYAPVPIEGKIEIRARMKEQKRNFVIMDITLTANGTLCSVAEATYYCFSREKAEKEFHFLPYEVEE